MNFRPMLDRVLIQQAEAETKTASGFIIPDAVVEKANKGTVIAMGPGRSIKDGQVIPIANIKVGDLIMFEGKGIPITVNGQQMIVLKEDEIIAIVD